MMKKLVAAAALCLALMGHEAQAQEKVVRIYNWSDYIDPTVLEDFTKETGIKVVYDVYDSNDVLEAKLLAGRTGYDIVVPSSYRLARQLGAGIYETLDRSKIPNWKNLDPALMAKAAQHDPDNAHSFIWMWGTTGLAFNEDKVKQLVPDAPLDSWALLFDPKYASKLKDCGIYVLDAADDALPSALAYLGLDPNSSKQEDLDKAKALYDKVRPYIRKFHSSENINALANGDICLTMIYSGDAGIAATRADEAKNGVNIKYVIPKEGAQLWFDTMAMPKDAPDKDEAYAFMNYVLQPKVMAKVSNVVTYPNAVTGSLDYINDDVKSDPNTFPPPDVVAKLFVKQPWDQRVTRYTTRLWQSITTGH